MRLTRADVANVILIGTALIVAFFIDAAIPPRSHFSSAPFAIPILIAAVRLRPPGIVITSVVSTMVAIVAASFDQAPPIPVVFSLVSLLIIGSLSTLLGQLRLIAARRAREAEDAREQISRILSSITEAFCALDRDWRFTYVNPEAQRLLRTAFGKEPGRLIGRRFWEEFPRAWDSRFGNEMRRAMTEQRARSFESFFAPTDAWFEIYLYPTPGGLSLYMRDVTRRKRVEEERERLLTEVQIERARLQTILESVANAIVYLDALTGRVIVNPAAEKLFGQPVIPHPGAADFGPQLLCPDGSTIAPADSPLERALHGQTVPQQEILVVRADGQRVPVLANAVPIRGTNGQVVGVVVVFQDISALKELERLREEWTSVIAHDLRQPVTVIRGYASLLARKLERMGLAEEEAAAQHILASIRNLDKMVGDLLDVSRIEARRLTLKCELVDLPLLVRAVVERTETVTAGHPVCIQIHGEIPLLEADPGRIEQVLGNLLSNAATYGDAGTPIWLDLERRGRYVELAVTNRGPGIPPD